MKIISQYDRKPIPFRGYDWISHLEDAPNPRGFGATLKKSISDLAEFLVESNEDLLREPYTHTCTTCGGTGEIEVTHPRYGSPTCPEPWTDIQCPDCHGSGERTLELEDLLYL